MHMVRFFPILSLDKAYDITLQLRHHGQWKARAARLLYMNAAETKDTDAS